MRGRPADEKIPWVSENMRHDSVTENKVGIGIKSSNQRLLQADTIHKEIALKTFLISTVALTLLTGAAFAGPAEDMAKARIDAIAKGDVAAVTSSYADGAILHWVGGPLDGQYTGPDKLKEVWGKFTKAQGDQKATVAAIAESANPKGSTVTASVAFAGKNTVKVRYVMVYRDGKLADEIWQVDPNATF